MTSFALSLLLSSLDDNSHLGRTISLLPLVSASTHIFVLVALLACMCFKKKQKEGPLLLLVPCSDSALASASLHPSLSLSTLGLSILCVRGLCMDVARSSLLKDLDHANEANWSDRVASEGSRTRTRWKLGESCCDSWVKGHTQHRERYVNDMR